MVVVASHVVKGGGASVVQRAVEFDQQTEALVPGVAAVRVVRMRLAGGRRQRMGALDGEQKSTLQGRLSAL